jgi:phosphatidylglycerol---prolipoprotein diacylglyceryl transferase
MYPNLYYVFKDWFGIEWQWLKIFNTFGLFVAIAFVAAAIVLSAELKRREKLGLLHPTGETIVVGKAASIIELIFNALIGFIFGAKIIGVIFSRPAEVSPQHYLLSMQGSIVGGLLMAALLVAVKWQEKNKQKLKVPERRSVRIWPHDRVGDIIILGLIFGILGAKLFDNFEHWDVFMNDPIGQLFSVSGLTFYGGLILASIAICYFGYKKGINIAHLVDSAAACLMIAYAIGRIGCQVSGDGDWGVYNSAYISDAQGNVSLAAPGDFDKMLQKNASYFLEGKVTDATGKKVFVTDRTYASLDAVPHQQIKGVSFLPKWMFAYSYPQNVNNDGIPIPDVTEEHFSVLPSPVFPTPFYETIICSLLFLFLWAIRKKIKTPLLMFGIYLILNGCERFVVELVRVNKAYNVSGIVLSQAQEIAIGLVAAGVLLIVYAKFIAKKVEIIEQTQLD